MRRRLTVLAAVCGLIVASAGCGGSDDGGGGDADISDLTKMAPADSVLFVESAVQPDGDVKDSVQSILDRFPGGGDLGQMLVDEINSSAKEDGSDLNYEDDIKPWLGERGAFFATSFNVNPSNLDEGSDAELESGAAVVETTDEDKALETLKQAAEEDGPVEERQYEGVTYEYGTDKTGEDGPSAFAVTDGVVIVGTEQGLQDAIDASKGDSLSSQSEYANFRDDNEEGLLGSLYVDAGGLIDSIPNSAGFGADERATLEKSYGQYLKEPILGALQVEDDQATFDFSAAETDFTDPAQSSLLDAGFPDSWAAFAVSQFGRSFGAQTGFIPEDQMAEVNAQLQKELGFSFSDLSSIGDVAAFASGESILDLQVGGLVQIADPAVQTKLLNALRTGLQKSGQAKVAPLTLAGADDAFSIQLPDLPVPINVASKGDQVAIGAGPATQALLSGEGGLTGSELYSSAKDALGDGSSVAFLLEMEPIIALVESTGQGDADFTEAKPYLEAFDFFTAGVERADGRDNARFVVRFSEG